MENAMKSIAAFALGAALLLWTSVAWSQEATPKPEQRRGGKPASATARMDEQMKKLRTLHESLTTAGATPAERQKAMDDARKEMQASIAMMQQPVTRGGPSGEDGAANEDVLEGVMPGRKGGGGGARGHGQVAAKRMEMMLMMMQLIVDQQALLAAPTAGDAAPRKTGTTPKGASKSAKGSDAAARK
jgi:hypothetical protein